MQNKRLLSLQRWMAIGIAVAVLACVQRARPSLVNVDFNTSGSATYIGAAVVASAGDTRSGINGGDSGSPARIGNVALLDSTGDSTGVTLSVAGASGAYDTGSGGCQMVGSPSAALMGDYMMGDSIYRPRLDVAVMLAGLTPGAVLDQILHSMADRDGRITRFTLGGVTQAVAAAVSDFVWA
jgi:hypothetical protein